MSYKNPQIPTLTLKGLDAKIQVIQGQLDTGLSWLSKSFGLADRIVEERDGKPYIFPASFESNTFDPIPLTPSDAWDSFCFWIKDGDTKFDEKTNPMDPLMTCPVSCIFYIDIHKISTGSYKETKSKLIEDIIHLFNNIKLGGTLVPTKFIEDDITEVFKGFTIDQLDNKFKMYPKWTCRMNFDLSYRNDCYVTNT